MLIACPLEGLIFKWYGEAEQILMPSDAFRCLPMPSDAFPRYGEGEQKLAALFERCERIGPCILFLDEIDALGGTRDKEMHEASRRMVIADC